MIKIFYIYLIILMTLVNTSDADICYQVTPNKTNTEIVRKKEEIEIYKKFFVNFMPDKFKINKNGYLIFTDKYKNDSQYEYIKNMNGILVSFVTSGSIENKDFMLILVWAASMLDDNYYAYEVFSIKNEYNGSYHIESYVPDNSLYCFFGIITDNDCMNHATFDGKTKVDTKEFNKFIKKFKL